MASKYLEWLCQDEQREKHLEMTPAEKRKNWWEYHKWYLLLGAIASICLVWMIWDIFNIGQPEPDCQIAYVGADVLPTEGLTALEKAFASLGTDADGDGQVLVTIHPYSTYETILSELRSTGEVISDEIVLQSQAATVNLMVDIQMGDSFFFLLDDPETFQQEYGVLSRLDGSWPEEGSAELCTVPLAKTPVFERLSPEWQEVFSRLYLARRGFAEGQACKYPEECLKLWETLSVSTG